MLPRSAKSSRIMQASADKLEPNGAVKEEKLVWSRRYEVNCVRVAPWREREGLERENKVKEPSLTLKESGFHG